jgi:hypothetical protein
VTHYRLHLADEPMSYTRWATLPDALDELRSIYGGGIAVETNDERTLVWACGADAQDDDDGVYAVAEIIRCRDDVARIDVPLAALDVLDLAIDLAIDHWSHVLRHEAEHYTDDDVAKMRRRIAQAKALCGTIAGARAEARSGGYSGEVLS